MKRPESLGGGEPREPKGSEQYWVKTSDVKAQDLGAVVGIYRNLFKLPQPPEDVLSYYEELLMAFTTHGYAESYLGGGAKLELHGIDTGALVVRIKVITPGRQNDAMQQGIDDYFKDKGIELIPSRDVC